MRVEGHPRVGDVYERKYGPAKGKRVWLINFNDAPVHLKRWFDVQTVFHPTSPQMVGSTSGIGLQQLEDQWRYVKGAPMTDPVDTDALRRDARVLAPGFPGVEKRLNAAADELDRQRGVIDNAPHARTCYYEQTAHWDDSNACDCWKADAL